MVNAWVSGGFLPASMKGRKLDGLSTVWDWYSTFAHLGGVDPTDVRASSVGLPPVDSINLWPYLSGATLTSPRTSIPIGSSSCRYPKAPNCTNFWGEGTETVPRLNSHIHKITKIVDGRGGVDGRDRRARTGRKWTNATDLGRTGQDVNGRADVRKYVRFFVRGPHAGRPH